METTLDIRHHYHLVQVYSIIAPEASQRKET